MGPAPSTGQAPWGAPLIKDYRLKTKQRIHFIRDLTRPGPKAWQNYDFGDHFASIGDPKINDFGVNFWAILDFRHTLTFSARAAPEHYAYNFI